MAPQFSDQVGMSDGPGLNGEFTLDGVLYFANRSRYDDTGLETIVSWLASEITETQRRLTWMVAGGIAIITLLCSALGIVFAKRISRPLERLRDAAIELRSGDLTTPVLVHTRVQEIAQVAYALEDARIALEHTLTELRQEKAWVDQLLGSVVEGIVTLDRQWRITFFSQGAERISGWKQEHALGKSVDTIFRLEGGNERFSQRIHSAGENQEIVTVRVNNRPVVLAITGAKLAPPEAGKAQMVLVLRDVSNEQAIRRLLGDFLANITHEFRTPLSALAASIELLLDQLPELTQVELNELLTSLHLGILGLQTLIDNLLEAASIEAGRFHVAPKTMELVDVIDEAARTMQPLLQKYNHRLQVNLPADLPLVKVDPRRTIQVLVNLISNAIKWGPGDTEINLSATTFEHEVKIIITDQGPGVLPEHKEGLFTRFAHVHMDNNRAEYGAGLGLSVVKAIVEAQGGQVGVEDQPGGGAIFWFTVLTVSPENESEKRNI
jgi:PAS domain S-box-containing protein